MILSKYSAGKCMGLAAMIAVLHTTTALATDLALGDENSLPAVSGVNAKLDFSYLYTDLGGPVDDVHGAAVVGSLSAPLGQRFGWQIDAGLSRNDAGNPVGDIDQYGIAGHVFTRDPSVGLLGVYAHYLNTDFGLVELDSYRYGIEAEWYLNQVSLEGFAGADHVDGGAIDQTYANLDFTAAYYINDNTRIEAGVNLKFDETVATIGFEAILPMFHNNTSIYTNASFGDDATSVRAGLRIYFGEQGKSLIDRHRQDDPKPRLLDLNGLDVCEFVQPSFNPRLARTLLLDTIPSDTGCGEAPMMRYISLDT
ncbi:MAG: hypothetical protein ABJM29_08325 [Rhizobiaceae bacterium]